MEISIETGKSENLSAINDIYNHYVSNSYVTFDTNKWDAQRRLDWFKQFEAYSELYKLLVAKIEGQVVGFAYNSKFRDKPAYITSSEVTVYIKPGLEGNGLGGKLYDVLLPKIVDSKLHRLYAAISIPNIASIKLHESYDFKIIGTMTDVGFKNNKFYSVALYEKSINN